MKGLILAGAIFVALGVIGLAVPIFTTQETSDVAKIGDLKLQSTENTSHSIPPLLAGSSLILGIVMVGGGIYRKR
jgi:hypothetical protein